MAQRSTARYSRHHTEPGRREAVGSKSVYVKNLSENLTKDVLANFMAQAGPVISVSMNADRRGVPTDAVVEYSQPACAQRAIIELGERHVLGVPIVIRLDDGRSRDGFSCYKCGGDNHIARNCKEEDRCYKCGSTEHIARECSSDQILVETRTCFYCKKPGHLAKDCPSETGDGCYKCGKKGHIARSCPEETALVQDQRPCFVCKKPGHLIKDCPEKPEGDTRECYKCGQVGHIGRDCALPDERPCHLCGRKGHLARACPEGGAGGQDSRACHNCGKPGHIARDCRNAPAAANQFSQGAGGQRCRWGYECRYLMEGGGCMYLHSDPELQLARKMRMRLEEQGPGGRMPAGGAMGPGGGGPSLAAGYGGPGMGMGAGSSGGMGGGMGGVMDGGGVMGGGMMGSGVGMGGGMMGMGMGAAQGGGMMAGAMGMGGAGGGGMVYAPPQAGMGGGAVAFPATGRQVVMTGGGQTAPSGFGTSTGGWETGGAQQQMTGSKRGMDAGFVSAYPNNGFLGYGGGDEKRGRYNYA